jgi:hypothetical protein
MSDIEGQRPAMADQPASDDYPTLERRYPAAEPLFITCMFGPFASILSAAVASEALVAEVNSHFASDREGRRMSETSRDPLDIQAAVAPPAGSDDTR